MQLLPNFLTSMGQLDAPLPAVLKSRSRKVQMFIRFSFINFHQTKLKFVINFYKAQNNIFGGTVKPG